MRKPTSAEFEDAEAVAALEEAWNRVYPDLSPEQQARFDELLAKWAPLKATDPIVIDCDLLSPLGLEFRETRHTQVLAYLLHPSEGHGLGSNPLSAFLSLIDSMLPEREAEAFAEASERVDEAVVLAERASLAGGAQGQEEEAGKLSRTDLWVEIPGRRPNALVVVEAKIDGVAARDQLGRYDRLVDDRLRSIGRSIPVVKLYLTPFGDPPPLDSGGGGWIAVSLLSVAGMLTRILDEMKPPGREFLRLYLATVFQKVLRLRWSDSLSSGQKLLLSSYLEMRVGETDR